MKKKVTIHTDGFEGFRKRSLERAKKLDRGELLSPEKIITLEKGLPSLTPARLRVFQEVKKQETSIASLAKSLNRPREAVSRDVSALKSFGIVNVREVPNPRHGRAVMVSAAARKIFLEL